MLPGFHGHLVSEHFLEQTLERTVVRPALPQNQQLGPATSIRAMLEAGAAPLVRALGFTVDASATASGACLTTTLRAGAVPVTLLVVPWGERLDPLWRPAVVAAQSSGAEWCILFNGTRVRVVNAGRVSSRRYVEIAVAAAVQDDRTRAALWTVASAAAFDPARAGLKLERLTAESERYAAAVCQSLRDGVLEAAQLLFSALTARRVESVPAAFDQALTLVYRILFLLFAEARLLVPLWHPVYRESYSIEQLRDDAVRRSAHGSWDALRAISRLAHAGCSAGDLRVTPFNGRLFAPARTPLADRRDLNDESARRSILALTTRPAADGEARDVISYRDLGVEQLGAVYETLLDYAPDPHPAAPPSRRGPAIIVTLRPGTGVRKSTGTFYTPQPIAHYLVRHTLGPLIRGRTAEQILQLRVLDPSMGSGAFLVAACGFLAEAYEGALIESGAYHASDFGPADHAATRRMIAERCVYGVDLNPMAVQLARLSLWLTSLAADRPLSFLDHHLVAGDSLLGTWIASMRLPPVNRKRRRESLPLFDGLNVADAIRHALPARFELALAPNDTPQQVRAKERTLASLTAAGSPLAKWKRVADLWCAGWFAGDRAAPASAFMDLSDALLTGRAALPSAARARFLNDAADIAAARRFFHWELEFPEVFFDPNGARLPDAGFDAVLGNPPWDMVRGDAGTGDDRVAARQLAEATVRFTRDSGVYTSQSDGHANRYQLFLERAVALTRIGGRLGLVMPSGLCADHGSARLRRALFSQCDVEALVGFDNRKAIFPIHRSVRFVLLTATKGSPTQNISCRFGESDPAVLDEPRDGVHLTPALIARLSGDVATIPDLRSPQDLGILERAVTLFPALGAADGWNVTFGRELNATDDRGVFRPTGSVPVIGGKQIAPFHCDVAGSLPKISMRDASRLLGDRWHHARLAYRDVASPTNRMTLIAAILPAGSASTHTVFCLKTKIPPIAQQFLCGLFNSFVVNFLARLWVTTHVTTAIVERLPVPLDRHAAAGFPRIAAAARLLARRHDAVVLAELNARVADLYQLTDEELAHVLSTFPLVPHEERDAVMRAFRGQH